MTFRSFVRPLVVAFSLAFATTAALPAFADSTDNAKAAEHKGHGKEGKRGKGKKDEKFPVAGDKFAKGVEKRITKTREKLGNALTKHNVAEAKKTEILREFDAGAQAVRDAAKVATKDGNVTKEEAQTVRATAKALKKQIRSKYLPKSKANKGADKAKDV